MHFNIFIWENQTWKTIKQHPCHINPKTPQSVIIETNMLPNHAKKTPHNPGRELHEVLKMAANHLLLLATRTVVPSLSRETKAALSPRPEQLSAFSPLLFGSSYS